MTSVQLIEASPFMKQVIGAREQGGDGSKRVKVGGVEDMNDRLGVDVSGPAWMGVFVYFIMMYKLHMKKSSMMYKLHMMKSSIDM